MLSNKDYKISTTLLSTDRVNISPYECRSLLLLIGDTKKWLKKTSTEVKSTVWLLFSGFSRIASLQLLTYYVFSQIWPFGFFFKFRFWLYYFRTFWFFLSCSCAELKEKNAFIFKTFPGLRTSERKRTYAITVAIQYIAYINTGFTLYWK